MYVILVAHSSIWSPIIDFNLRRACLCHLQILLKLLIKCLYLQVHKLVLIIKITAVNQATFKECYWQYPCTLNFPSRHILRSSDI